LECPKCKAEMIQGFVPDHSRSSVLVGARYPGQPKWSFWSQTKAPAEDAVPIGAFRCPECGFLEFYADAKFAAE
jgi:hypothetical protein